MFETAHCAVGPVRVENAFAKGGLVQAFLHCCRNVATPEFGLRRVSDGGSREVRIDFCAAVGHDCKCKLPRVIAGDEHRADGEVVALRDGMEVDQRNLVTHGITEANVIAMRGVVAAIAVRQPVRVLESVEVGTVHHGRDRQRVVAVLGGEDTVRRDKRDPSAIKIETSLQDRPWQQVGVRAGDCIEPVEGPKPHFCIPRGSAHAAQDKAKLGWSDDSPKLRDGRSTSRAGRRLVDEDRQWQRTTTDRFCPPITAPILPPASVARDDTKRWCDAANAMGAALRGGPLE